MMIIIKEKSCFNWILILRPKGRGFGNEVQEWVPLLRSIETVDMVVSWFCFLRAYDACSFTFQMMQPGTRGNMCPTTCVVQQNDTSSTVFNGSSMIVFLWSFFSLSVVPTSSLLTTCAVHQKWYITSKRLACWNMQSEASCNRHEKKNMWRVPDFFRRSGNI